MFVCFVLPDCSPGCRDSTKVSQKSVYALLVASALSVFGFTMPVAITPLLRARYWDTTYIYIHTTARCGLRKDKKLAGVYNFPVYMQSVQICSQTRHHGGTAYLVCLAAYLFNLHIH